MKSIVIKINNINYTSIGDFMDNNDGIHHYYPDKNDFTTWSKTLYNESLLIKTWIIGNIYYEFTQQNLDNLFPEVLIKNIRNNFSIINTFVEKYFIDDGIHLNEDFEDFIFGRFSEYGNNFDIKKEISIDETIFIINFICKEESFLIEFSLIPGWESEDYCFEISNKVFVKEEKLKILLFDINNVFSHLLEKL
jgi:hypothetical protein